MSIASDSNSTSGTSPVDTSSSACE
uniref:Uncharacterized protein n=1 Tax=Anopheles albimanus TaxID=7167 RepID=A0A182FY74_ANOAL